MRVWLKWSALGFIVIFAGMQLSRPSRTSPTEDQTRTIYAHEPMTGNVRATLKKSCNDCHSSQTVWPWYTNVVPISWIIASHVRKGRAELNFSKWASYSSKDRHKLLGEICEQSTSREMPGISYTSVHANTHLADSEIQSVCAWTNKQMESTLRVQPDALGVGSDRIILLSRRIEPNGALLLVKAGGRKGEVEELLERDNGILQSDLDPELKPMH